MVIGSIRRAPENILIEADWLELEGWSRSRRLPVLQISRAKIRLRVTDGAPMIAIGAELGGPPALATNWSRALMAQAAGVNPSTMGRVWWALRLKHNRARAFKVSRDPLVRREAGGHRRPVSPAA